MKAEEEAEVNTSFVVPKDEDGSKASSDPGPSSTQTRFSFYNADEVNEALSPESQEEDPKRFNFYDAKEVNERSKEIVANRNKRLDSIKTMKTSPSQKGPDLSSNTNNAGSSSNRNLKENYLKKKEISSSVPTPRSDVVTVGWSDPREQPQSADSKEILRSLQEIEREREQRRMHRGAQNVTTPRHANTNGGVVSAGSDRDDKSSRREEDIATEAKLRKRVESTESLNSSTAGRVMSKANPYEVAIREALLLLRQQPPKPQVQEADMSVHTEFIEDVDEIMMSRTPMRVLSPKAEDLLLESEPSPDVDGLSSLASSLQETLSDRDNTSSSDGDLNDQERYGRQERIAKYTSALNDLEVPLEPRVSTHREGSGPATTPERQRSRQIVECNDERAGRHRRTSGADNSIGTFSSREEEVQRGVERVLLAILAQANAAEAGDRRHHTSADVLLQSRSSFDSEEVFDRTSLVNAIDSLLSPEPTYSMDSYQSQEEGRHSRPSRRESEHHDDEEVDVADVDEGMRKLSVVEELLAEEEIQGEGAIDSSEKARPRHRSVSASQHSPQDDENEQLDSSSREATSESSSREATSESTSREESDTPSATASEPQSSISNIDDDSAGRLSTSVEQVRDAQSTDDLDDEQNDDEHDVEYESDDMTDEGNDSISKVLGPLSNKAGGTTGVVLESYNSHSSSEHPEEDDDDDPADSAVSTDEQVSPPKPLQSDDAGDPASPTILQSLSVNAENFMSFMSSALTAESPTQEKYGIDDKYAPASEGEEHEDDEARELMRTLCAHLLPFGVDKFTQQHNSDKIPAWDDSNANEAGYRIIRLTKSQLRRVESEFDNMVNSVREKSERSLSKTNSLVGKDSLLDAQDGVLDEETDEGFERDLEEAEELLDREEKLYNAVKAVESAAQDESDAPADVSSDDTSHSESESSSSVDATVEGHPEFPGVRPPGKGEMGDLEFFHLPIIYKSNVTGFEPTKDLYLEPGNVVAGQYLVENELGSAAFSTAYRCIDLNSDPAPDSPVTHEEVCLKVIKNTKDFFDQSLDEIKILELLRKTGQCCENNIVEMRTFFYHREHLVIVTELLRQNLFEFGKFIIDNNEEQYFTLPRLCYITRQALVALKFVHSLGLVHSDVKPENILLSSYSRAKVKLIDFGSSCYLTDRQSSYIQSRSYRAPEVVLGLPYDGKIDIWSLGCVVAEMYTGEVTFQNDSIVSMLSRIEAICGPFPRHMIAQGRQSGRFFTSSGLLYEEVETASASDEKKDTGVEKMEGGEDEEDAHQESPELYDVFQPKSTTLAARLGFDTQLMELRKGTAEEQEQAMFVDFVRSLLTVDPDSRSSAEEALQHPWIVMGESLTEEDIKYPSS